MRLRIQPTIEPIQQEIAAPVMQTEPNDRITHQPKDNAVLIKKQAGMIPHCPHTECPTYIPSRGYGRSLSFYSDKTKLWSCYKCHLPIKQPVWMPRSERYTHRQKRSASRSLERTEILNYLESIDENKRNGLRDRAIIAMLYLTGCRIEELVGMKDINGEFLVYPLRRSQIEQAVSNPEFMLIKEMAVLKRRSELKTDIDGNNVLFTPKRNVPINLTIEADYWRYVQDYLAYYDLMQQHHKSVGFPNKQDYLFKISPSRGWVVVNKHTGMFCHLFRHSRASHLVSIYGFSDSELKEFFGWATGAMAANYVHLNTKNLMNKMEK